VATLSLSTQHSPETLPCTGHTMLSLPLARRWPDCPSRRVLQQDGDRRALVNEVAAQIVTELHQCALGAIDADPGAHPGPPTARAFGR
jgi:hypothetical protein